MAIFTSYNDREDQPPPLKDYLLFIDTETTGLPKKWNRHYSVPNNWPYAVQVSWLIYSKDGKKIKEENHFINNDDFEITPAALNIHGFTKIFLQQNGKPRCDVLGKLSLDVQQYQPMVVGHFTALDYHIIGADFYREKLENPLEKLSTFCIMIASQHLQQNPNYKFLRLGNLYELLFKQPLLGQHNALTDATATADCFFELAKRNEIRSFSQPPIVFQQKEKKINSIGWVLVFLIILCSAFLIACFYG